MSLQEMSHFDDDLENSLHTAQILEHNANEFEEILNRIIL